MASLEESEGLVNEIGARRALAAQKAFRLLLSDRAAVGALDALSEDVMLLIDEFIARHRSILTPLMGADLSPSDTLTAVIGWIFGFPAGRVADVDGRMKEIGVSLMIAAYIAPWSAENAARVYRQTGGPRG